MSFWFLNSFPTIWTLHHLWRNHWLSLYYSTCSCEDIKFWGSFCLHLLLDQTSLQSFSYFFFMVFMFSSSKLICITEGFSHALILHNMWLNHEGWNCIVFKSVCNNMQIVLNFHKLQYYFFTKLCTFMCWNISIKMLCETEYAQGTTDIAVLLVEKEQWVLAYKACSPVVPGPTAHPTDEGPVTALLLGLPLWLVCEESVGHMNPFYSLVHPSVQREWQEMFLSCHSLQSRFM